jgi:hypothetical protein
MSNVNHRIRLDSTAAARAKPKAVHLAQNHAQYAAHHTTR